MHQGLLPAFSHRLDLRLRWVWNMLYDQDLVGELGALEILRLLDRIPEGCRIERDFLGVVTLAAAKIDASKVGQRYMATWIGRCEDLF